MIEWHRLLCTVLLNGVTRPDRTGVGTKSCFGLSAEFDNRPMSFPAVTTKQLAFKQMAGELASFIRGAEHVIDFQYNGCTIWNDNAEAWKGKRFDGDVGRIYGVQWRDWRSVDMTVDQLATLVDGLKADPYGRRHIVTAWNPGELHEMCLPPCHIFFQCYVEGDNLDIQVYMRSVDLFLGLPFDVASYALLQRLIGLEVGLSPRRLLFSFGDAHIYLNHFEACRTVLSRAPLPSPQLLFAGDTTLFSFKPGQALLVNYNHHGKVGAKLNV